MPKRLQLRRETPVSVLAATQAFGSELRVHLIHFFATTPARQVDAVRALGAERAVVSLNVRALVDTGVLVMIRPESNPRSPTFAVDVERFNELLDALRDYGETP